MLSCMSLDFSHAVAAYYVQRVWHVHTHVMMCRGGDARVLISTDVWARGLDVQQVGIRLFIGEYKPKQI